MAYFADVKDAQLMQAHAADEAAGEADEAVGEADEALETAWVETLRWQRRASRGGRAAAVI